MKLKEQLYHAGIETVTAKYVIEDKLGLKHDYYLKVGYHRGRPVYVDITMARHGPDITAAALVDVQKDALPWVLRVWRRAIDTTRTHIEMSCESASRLLERRMITLEGIAETWRGSRAEPMGHCEATGNNTLGPLDAAAQVIELRHEQWRQAMAHEYDEGEIEEMLGQCVAALEERPDDFTGWERTFIEDLELKNEEGHLSDNQLQKLEQVWEERGCG